MGDESNYNRKQLKKICHYRGGKMTNMSCNHIARWNAHLCQGDLLTAGDLAINQDKFYKLKRSNVEV